MAAVNRAPWSKDINGGREPLRILMPVDAGSSYAIKRGEICKVGLNTSDRPGPVTAATDKTLLVIADQEQKSTDVARMIPFIVPRPGDVFEFAISAARAVVFGDNFAIHSSTPSQTLAYTAAGTNLVARQASDHNCPEPEEKSVTRRPVSFAQVVFDEQASFFAQISGNS